MIALRLPQCPEKGYETLVAPDGLGGWDIDVYELFGGTLRLKDPDRSREGVTRDEALDVLFEYDNGAANELLEGLGVRGSVTAAAWDRHQDARRRGMVS